MKTVKGKQTKNFTIVNKTKSIDGYYAALFYMRPVTGSDATRNEFYEFVRSY